jgi:hypothetical protein
MKARREEVSAFSFITSKLKIEIIGFKGKLECKIKRPTHTVTLVSFFSL